MRITRNAAAWLAALLAAVPVVVLPASPASARPIEETFSISVAGDFGDAIYTQRDHRIVVNQSNQVDQQVMTVAVWRADTPVITFDFGSRDSSNRYLTSAGAASRSRSARSGSVIRTPQSTPRPG